MTSISVHEKAVVYRRALETALTDAGYRLENDSPDALVITIADEAAWSRVEEALREGVTVVALVKDLPVESVRRALAMGVHSVADWLAPADVIVECVKCAVRGELLMSRSIIGPLLDLTPRETVLDEITDAEREWLTRLAQGVTVSALARSEYASERVMHRRLQALYQKLGVTGRGPALVRSAKLGLISEES